MNESVDQLYERLLVLRAQTGDPAAFAELVGRYHHRLRYYLRKLIADDGTDDVLQEVWFDVFRSLYRLTDAGAFRAWIYRIARDRAYRELRRRRRSLRPLAKTDLVIADDEEEFTAEDAERVHAGLTELAREHREVLVLRFVEAMSYEDIARVVGCPLGTVRSRLHHAKKALRCVLERTTEHERERTR